MRLINLNSLIYLIIVTVIFSTNALSEETIDIWKNKKKENIATTTVEKQNNKKDLFSNAINSDQNNNLIKIDEEKTKKFEEAKLYGLYDPDENNFNLEMWQQTDATEFKKIMKRINKLNLSSTAESILVNTLFSNSFAPKNISEEEFVNIKVNWLINNNKDKLIENFLEKNQNFFNKKKLIQYLVDSNISSANLQDGCKKINFISKEIKDPYLEKFKIYCLIFTDKKGEANLLYDILKEQGKSDKFFDDKISYLLGISDKNDGKIKEDTLLNFYISSVTVKDFQYEPNKNTKEIIWKYLNSANLIKIDNVEDKQKIKELEIAANEDRLKKEKIFEIYQSFSFDLQTLLNAERFYVNYENTESRALIYQKYLLSDNIENQIEYLLLLKDLFKKDNLSNLYRDFLSNKLKEYDQRDIPKNLAKVVKKNIITEKKVNQGKIKYDDKILHRSKVLKFYLDKNHTPEKTQKDFNNVYKKIKRNKNYFFSAKDLALVESLSIDGISIPKEIKTDQISKKYSIPQNLLGLIDSKNTGFLVLKIVEIIGEDEVNNLDSETIYFITSLLNRSGLKKFRNKIITSALPLRA